MAEFTPTTGQPTPKLRWYQYRLRSLLLLMLAVSLVMSAYATLRKAARAQRASVEAVLKLGGKVTYDYEKDPANPTHQPPGPPWLRKLLGNDWFVTVTRVDLGQCPISDAGLEQFQGLPRLQVLDLAWTKVSDEGLGQLDRIPPARSAVSRWDNDERRRAGTAGGIDPAPIAQPLGHQGRRRRAEAPGKNDSSSNPWVCGAPTSRTPGWTTSRD